MITAKGRMDMPKRRYMILLAMLLVLILCGCDPYTPTTAPVLTDTAPITKPTASTAKPQEETTVPTSPDATTVPTTQHIHSYFGSAVAATCTQGGYMLHICQCGDRFTDSFTDPLGHSWGAWEMIQQPTVDKEGLRYRTCIACGARDEENIEKLPQSHTHQYEVEVVAPTCIDGGYTQYTCSCGASYRAEITKALGHSWSAWVVTREPTVTTEGLQMRSCQNCGETEQKSVDKLPDVHSHVYNKTVISPTCTQGGYAVYTCACGDSYCGDETVAMGHSFGSYTSNGDAGCTTDGTKTAICDRCDATSTISDEGSALGHRWGEWVTTKQPTVEAEGMQVRTCSACSSTDSRVIEKLTQEHIHAYTADVVLPTCTEQGYTRYTCVCGDTYCGDTVNKLGHSFTAYVPNGDATCTTDGTETAVCDRCEATSTISDEGSALGHSWGEWVTTKEPTADAVGTQTRTCEACGASDTQTLDKLPQEHVHDYKRQRVAATCTEGGYSLYTCECGDSYREETSEPKGHNWDSWIVTEDSTTTSEGIKKRTCPDCGAEEYGFVERLPSEDGFVFVSWSVTVSRNEDAHVMIKGQAGVEYDIAVYYKSGESSAKGLENKVADETGYVTWTWHVGGRTSLGTFEIVVSGGGETRKIYFTIEE